MTRLHALIEVLEVDHARSPA